MANNSSKGGKNVLVIGIGLVAVAAVVYFSFFYPPVPKEDAQGTIGMAKKYHSSQMSENDVALQNPEIQKFLQNDKIQAIVNNDAIRSALSSPEFASALTSPAFTSALATPELAAAMTGPRSAGRPSPRSRNRTPGNARRTCRGEDCRRLRSGRL